MSSIRSEGVCEELESTSWFTSCGCINHDVHNALKWAVLGYTSCKLTMRSAFIVIESLRNAYDLLVLHSSAWLGRVLRFEDSDGFDWAACWHLLDIEPQWVDQMCDSQMRWESGCLKVAKRYEGGAEAKSLVEMALMNVWSFRRFSDSRWISLGSSCRTLLAAVVLGLPDLVDEILANPRASSYFLSGFKHFSDRVARMTATVATCSFVSDSVLAALLDDDRVPSMLPRLVADIKDELAYAMGIDQSVWDFVGRAVGLRGEELRNDSVAASMTSAGFIHRRLREAQGHPWSLCVGDVDRNLDELRREEAPTERVALQIYRLLRIGYSRGAIKQGLALMANCPWSSVCVEQGHVCASMTMRRHKEYSANTMRARSMLLQARPLLSTPPELAQRQRLRNKIAKLDKMKPQHITGRQVFVRELNGLVKDMRRRGRALRPNMHAAVLKGHGERWRAMNPERRRAFETSAEELREERRREIADSRAELVAELEILQARIRRAVASGLPPLRMTSCALTAAQTSSLDALYNSGDFPAARVAELRALAMTPVVEPPQHVRDGLEALDVGEPTRPDRKPQWLGLVCRNRDFFTPTCVRIGQPDACEYWKFVYATKSPLMACFCKLNAVIDEATGAWGPPDYFATSLSHWEHRFQLDTASWMYTDAWPYEADVLVAFLTDCVHLREGVVASDADWLGLDAVRAILPDADAGDGETANADAVAKDKPAWVDHGWLLDFFPTGDCGGAVSQGDRQEGGASCGSQSWRSSADERLEAIDAEEVMDLLYERRLALEAGAPAPAKDFVWSLRGGAWTAEHRGVAYDVFRAEGIPGEPREFLALYGLAQSGSFSIAAYGEAEASELARYWCHRHQFLFDVWGENGADPGFRFQEAHLAAYEEPPFAAALHARMGRRGQQRLDGLRALAPAKR